MNVGRIFNEPFVKVERETVYAPRGSGPPSKYYMPAADVARLRSLKERIKCPPFKIHFEQKYPLPGCEEFVPVIGLDAPDRDTGIPTTVFRSDTTCSFRLDDPDEWIMRMIREAIKGLALHEIDENLTLDGKRIFDPHRNEQ